MVAFLQDQQQEEKMQQIEQLTTGLAKYRAVE